MISTKSIEKARQAVIEQQDALNRTVEEYNEVVDRVLQDAKAEAESRPLKDVEKAELMEVSTVTIWRIGANKYKTYAELRRFLQREYPKYLGNLETNYKKFIRQ